jgi:predicted Zn-dependent protease with MMP-like domain
MTTEEFEKLAAKALRRLPRAFRDRMENVVVTVQAAPDRAQVRRYGRGLLGLYEGVPLSERGAYYSGAMPDKITLFQDNIEKAAGAPERVEAQVRHTVMHELAHHFGMDDDELIEKGLY